MLRRTRDGSPLQALVAGRERAIEQALRAMSALPEEVRPHRHVPEAQGAGLDETAPAQPAPTPSPPPLASPPTQAQRRRLRGLLSSPDRLRQAILLQEILGPPTALRPRDQ